MSSPGEYNEGFEGAVTDTAVAPATWEAASSTLRMEECTPCVEKLIREWGLKSQRTARKTTNALGGKYHLP